jgi:hypothetical protein
LPACFVWEGGQGTADAAVEANGQLPASAFASTTTEDPSIDEAAFAEPVAAVDDGQLAGQAQAASAAADDAAVTRLVESLASGDKDLELELTGLPQELAKVKEQLESILAPILASGYTFADTHAGMEGQEMASRVLSYLGEEAQRIRYVQQLSVKQMVFLAHKLVDTAPEFAGLSADAVIQYARGLRAQASSHPDLVKEGSGLYQLMAVLDAEDRTRAGYQRHMRSVAGLLDKYKAQEGMNETQYAALESAFRDGAVKAEAALATQERNIRDGLSHEDDVRFANIPAEGVLFYTVATPILALKAEQDALSSDGRQEVPVSQAIVPVEILPEAGRENSGNASRPEVVKMTDAGEATVANKMRVVDPVETAPSVRTEATPSISTRPAASGNSMFGNRTILSNEQMLQDAADEHDDLTADPVDQSDLIM